MAEKTSDWRPGPTVCRCCLAEGCYKDISTEYFWMGKREVYAEMLSDTLSVSIAYSQSGGPNSNSRLICESCISRLRDATDFKRQVLECEKTFMNLLDPGSSTLVKELQLSMEEVKVEHVKTEKASMSDDDFDDQVDFVVENDDDDDDDLDDEPLMKLASKEPKKEVNITELLKNSQVTVKRKAAVKAKAPPAKKAKKQIVIKPTASKAAAKATASSTPKTEKKKKGSMEQSEISIIPADDDDITVLTVVKTPIPAESLMGAEVTPVPATEKIRESLDNTDTKKTSTPTYVIMPGYSKPMKLCRIRNSPPIICNIKNTKIPETGNKFRLLPEKNSKTSNYLPEKIITKSNYLPEEINRKCNYQVWKNHAMTIFENSYVYPFTSSRTNYKCYVCSKRFFDTHLLKKHTIEEHTLQEISKKMNSKASEMCMKVDVSHLMCTICSITLTSFRNLKLHIKHHGKDIDPEYRDNLIPFDLGDEKFKCLICGDVCLKLRILVTHMNKHFSNYNCEICGAVFCAHYLLKQHMKIHTSESFPCQVCNKVFGNSNNRSRHYREVHLKLSQRRICPLCPERFLSNYRRTQHLRIVHNRTTGLFKCETCGKEYDLKDHLLTHVKRAHLKETNHECSICHHRFFSKSELKKHAVVHTKEKKYLCEICCMLFLKKSTLIMHMKIHNNDEGCSICGQVCTGHSEQETGA